MSALKWARSPFGRTSNANIGPFRLVAWSGDVVAAGEFAVHGVGDSLDVAEAAAETKLRKAFDALREHFDPLPVLRWERVDGVSFFDHVARLGSWRLESHASGWWAVLLCNDDESSRAQADAGTAPPGEAMSAAEAVLAALGVRFAVEGGER